jgi:hypothetical protein
VGAPDGLYVMVTAFRLGFSARFSATDLTTASKNALVPAASSAEPAYCAYEGAVPAVDAPDCATAGPAVENPAETRPRPTARAASLLESFLRDMEGS